MSDFNPESVHLCSLRDQSAISSILPHSSHGLNSWRRRSGSMAARYPSHGPLRFVTSHSRLALASMRNLGAKLSEEQSA